MKNIFKSIFCLLAAGSLLTVVSCGDKFLDEVRRTTISTDYLETPEGLYSMSESLYMNFGTLFYAEGYWPFTNAGTDEFMIGGDGASEAYNTYDSRLSSSPTGSANTVKMSWLWDNLYPWISRANTILNNGDRVMGNSPLYNEAMGTAYFTRAYNYLMLVMQYGDVPLVTIAPTSPEREYGRDSKEAVYDLIISDLEKAYELLPETGNMTGKVTKYAAAHYLAKAHLWRASEINDDWNAKYVDEDLEECIKYADIVIAAHPLATRYEDLFADFTGYDTSITETNTEVVFASQKTKNTSIANKNSNNMTLCWFVAPYQNTFLYMERDVAGGRSYQRMKTTPRYAYYLYDLENDSRFWKSFKTTYAVNKADAYSGEDNTYTMPDGTTASVADYFDSNFSAYLGGMYVINRAEYEQKFGLEDVTIGQTPTRPTFTVKDYATNKYIPVVRTLLAYDSNGEAVKTSFSPNKDGTFAPLSKYLDGAVDQYNLANGYRDVIFARSAEDYFFKAEAMIRQGDIDGGLAVLKPLRDRAQFRAGEARDEYHDGGQAFETSAYRTVLTNYTNKSVFYPRNSYFYSVGGWDQDQAYRDGVNAQASVLPDVSSSNYPAEDQYIMNVLAEVNPDYASDQYTRALCFVLNEKSREMYGEFHRWMDLARTKTLEDRLVFNDQAWSTSPKDILGNTEITDENGTTVKYISDYGGNFNPDKHYLRPIPQNFLDLINKDGKPLTTEEKNQMQNPGY